MPVWHCERLGYKLYALNEFSGWDGDIHCMIIRLAANRAQDLHRPLQTKTGLWNRYLSRLLKKGDAKLRIRTRRVTLTLLLTSGLLTSLPFNSIFNQLERHKLQIMADQYSCDPNSDLCGVCCTYHNHKLTKTLCLTFNIYRPRHILSIEPLVQYAWVSNLENMSAR